MNRERLIDRLTQHNLTVTTHHALRGDIIRIERQNLYVEDFWTNIERMSEDAAVTTLLLRLSWREKQLI